LTYIKILDTLTGAFGLSERASINSYLQESSLRTFELHINHPEASESQLIGNLSIAVFTALREFVNGDLSITISCRSAEPGIILYQHKQVDEGWIIGNDGELRQNEESISRAIRATLPDTQEWMNAQIRFGRNVEKACEPRRMRRRQVSRPGHPGSQAASAQA